jgi:hypothetical protein
MCIVAKKRYTKGQKINIMLVQNVRALQFMFYEFSLTYVSPPPLAKRKKGLLGGGRILGDPFDSIQEYELMVTRYKVRDRGGFYQQPAELLN